MSEAVIVAGIRTPFVQAGTKLGSTPAPELGRLVVREIIDRHDLDPAEVDELICGNVASPVDAANVARVIALRAGIPKDKIAHTVSRNCASGMECVTQAYDRITSGRAKCVIAVGVDSMSHIPVFWSKTFSDKLFAVTKAKSAMQKLKALWKIKARDLTPQIGIKMGLTDPVTGMMMGDTADKLAREYDISRQEQDEFALKSHEKAVQAWDQARLADETMTIYPEPKSAAISADIGPREDQSMKRLERLKPYFDRKWGTVTVGNACQVTDGAVALLLMDAEYAEQLGYEPIGRIRSYAYAGCDPSRMGLGPVYASARALQDADMHSDDMDLVEINEAFAAQVLACTRGFENPPDGCTNAIGAEHLGHIPEEKLNVNGGAIALGHPVGATGARLILTMLHELKRRDKATGLATLCIGGGQGGAMVVERVAA
ncbi:MAG: acetyl-CoA C-acyltransferase [Planctomycetaceae bacterium]|nr:acetyl-CoA C-acyltransferase [Planctomycetaceae bacterium]